MIFFYFLNFFDKNKPFCVLLYNFYELLEKEISSVFIIERNIFVQVFFCSSFHISEIYIRLRATTIFKSPFLSIRLFRIIVFKDVSVA